MRRALTTVLLGLLAIFFTGAIAKADNPYQLASDKENVYFNEYSQDQGRSINFNDNWKFNLGDVSGADQEKFDDSAWESVNLPHDYSIDQDYSQSMEAESGYLPGGIGWYRKTFTLKDFDSKEDSVRIDFDGVYMDSTVYVNGQKLGNHPYGYTPFSYGITPFVRNGENTIAVKVNHQTPSSRWYSGSGIYRDVHLTMTNDVHVDLFGSKFDTHDLANEMATENKSVTVFGSTNVKNNSDTEVTATVKYELYEKNNLKNAVASSEEATVTVQAKQTANVTKDFEVVNPKLWDTVNPNLYTIRTIVSVDNTVVDTYDTDFGFRYYKFDANNGFSLNGENIKLQGVSMHHDQGPLGAVANKDAQERQVQILKEMGVNSIRVTHNPASQTLIDLCNEYGILVVEEAFDGWFEMKNGNRNDYARFFETNVSSNNNRLIGSTSDMAWPEFDLKMMIERGYNSPSIFMWSLGNEVMEGTANAQPSKYPTTHKKLTEYTRKYDKYRPVTTGDNKLKANWSEAITMANQNMAAGGAVGFNYANGDKLDQMHRDHPEWNMYGAETASAINSRGVYYKTDGNQSNKELTSYDNSAVGWGHVASQAWYMMITRDFMAGEYVWTGFDYLGEPTPWNGTGPGASGQWPSPKSSYFGIVDTAGMPKDTYYFYQSQWAPEKNTLHVLPAWNEDVVKKGNDGKVPVVVYSSAAKVQLKLTDKNGEVKFNETKEMNTFKSNSGQGMYEYQALNQGKNHTDLYYQFSVPYFDGTLEAIAYDTDGNVIEHTTGRNVVKTTGDEYKLQAKTNKTEITADGKSLAYIQVDVVDQDGNIVPDAKNLITANVTGTGTFKVMDNGKQADHTKYTVNSREAYNGSVVVVVESKQESGTMTVDLSSAGLEGCKVEIKTVGDTGEKTVVGANMSKYYYLKANTNLSLPSTVDLLYSDGTKKATSVTWDLEGKDFSKPGVVNVEGTVEGGYKVSVVVNVIDKIGGVYNYSTYTPKGVVPELPSKLQAYDLNGEKMNINLDVTWTMPEDEVFNTAGIVTIEGTAKMFDQEVKVIATVDVTEGEVEYSSNVAPAALTLKQDIPEGHQSDNLNAIIDKNLVPGQGDDSGNPTLWSNYKYSQEGHNKANITFEYATQQIIGKVKIHFVTDSVSLRLPDANTLKIYVSETGVEGSWQEVHYEEKIGPTNGRVTPYEYTFDPVQATFVKFEITNSTQKIPNKKACTGIVELEIFAAQTKYPVSSTAALEELTINGQKYTAEQLTSGYISTLANTAEVTAKGKDNTAVTVLPQVGNQIKIHMVSEDGTDVKEFIVRLGEFPTISPSDSKANYSGTLDFKSLPQEQPNMGIDKALDNNPETLYHSKWDINLQISDNNPVNVIVNLENPTFISGIRYLPKEFKKNGDNNGRIGKYEVYVSDSKFNAKNDIEFKKVAEGTLADENGWKLISFDPQEVSCVKFVIKSTYGDTGQTNKFLNMAEFALVDSTKILNSLEEAVSNFEDITADGYTPNTFKEFNDALAAAQAVLGNEQSTPEQKEEAKVNLTKAYLSLVKQGDATRLNELLEEKLNEKEYTPSTWAKYQEAMENARKADISNMSQEEIDTLVVAIELAKEGLLKYANTEALENLVNNPADTSTWTTSSKNTYDALINEAKALLETELTENDQAKIDELVAKINSAIETHETKGDTTKLDELLSEELDSSKYTEESWAKYQEAINAAKEADKADMTQEEIDVLVSAIETAKKALVDKPVDPTEPEDGGLSGGAIAGIVIGTIAGIALLGGAIYFVMKKRK